MALGVHLLIDGEDCRADAFEVAVVERALAQLVERLALTAIAPPQVYAQDDGVVGIQLVSESHVSIHARRALRRVHADVFSCRTFDAAAAVRTLREVFGFKRHTERTVER